MKGTKKNKHKQNPILMITFPSCFSKLISSCNDLRNSHWKETGLTRFGWESKVEKNVGHYVSIYPVKIVWSNLLHIPDLKPNIHHIYLVILVLHIKLEKGVL